MIESIARQCYRCNYCGLFQCGGRHGATNYTLSFDGARYGALLEEHVNALTAERDAARAWAAAWRKAAMKYRALEAFYTTDLSETPYEVLGAAFDRAIAGTAQARRAAEAAEAQERR